MAEPAAEPTRLLKRVKILAIAVACAQIPFITQPIPFLTFLLFAATAWVSSCSVSYGVPVGRRAFPFAALVF